MTGATPDTGTPPAAPLLRVVRGRPTAHEIAALTTVLAAALAAAPSAQQPPPAGAPRGGWLDPRRRLRGPAPRGWMR